MKKNVLLIGLLLLATALHAQKPTVASMVNAGSYAVGGLPNAAVAQGSLFVLFGTNIRTPDIPPQILGNATYLRT